METNTVLETNRVDLKSYSVRQNAVNYIIRANAQAEKEKQLGVMRFIPSQVGAELPQPHLCSLGKYTGNAGIMYMVNAALQKELELGTTGLINFYISRDCAIRAWTAIERLHGNANKGIDPDSGSMNEETRETFAVDQPDYAASVDAFYEAMKIVENRELFVGIKPIGEIFSLPLKEAPESLEDGQVFNFESGIAFTENGEQIVSQYKIAGPHTIKVIEEKCSKKETEATGMERKKVASVMRRTTPNANNTYSASTLETMMLQASNRILENAMPSNNALIDFFKNNIQEAEKTA